jgi:hypothetical protein
MMGTMLSLRLNWQKLFSYGEVVCFISAWAMGLLIAMQNERTEPYRLATQTSAATSDALGLQATLSP